MRGSAVFQILGAALSFFLIPLMIEYLGAEKYGVWSTVMAIMSWILLCDLGIGNGLRNKVAELIAKGDSFSAKEYISSSYTSIGMAAFILWILFIGCSFLIEWQVVFNTASISESSLRAVFQATVSFILFNFFIGLVAPLLGAVQKSSLISLGQFITNLLVFALVVIISKLTEASLLAIAFAYGFSLIISNTILSIIFYSQHRELIPQLHLKIAYLKPILSVGIQFFIIQIASIVIFTTDRIIIAQVFGPEYIAQYDVVFKLFSSITIVHGLILGGLWSAYTDAFHRKDLPWLKGMLRNQLIFYIGIFLATITLVVSAKFIIGIWIGKQFIVSDQLVLAMGGYALITTWNNIFAIFLNGVGKIKIQLFTAVIGIIINIPLTIFFSKYLGFGLAGIVMGMICTHTTALFVFPLVVNRILGGSNFRWGVN
jgi:O-antigen/teichoic acid export membrane protein